ncbi:MAG: pirin family protein [Ignavibacteriaceae bacterium]|nr:pirin family protein [Ignavibacteriaceae bacterium]
MLRKITNIYAAKPAHMEGLLTWRAIPVGDIQAVDPFIFLNHHGPQVFPPDNNGLPFGPHPHRGFETVTFIIDGDVMHTDSSGGRSIITSGGVQWMTAGSGLIHAEVSSEDFMKNGGKEEVLQLWVNLPAKHKMAPPAYYGFQKHEMPSYISPDGKVSGSIISGSLGGIRGAVQTFHDVNISLLSFTEKGEFTAAVPPAMNILLYMVSGRVAVNVAEAVTRNLVSFGNEGDEVKITALEKSEVIFGFAPPLNEPVVSYGPFVMNTEDEIREAIRDYQSGKMGVWEE